MPSTYLISGCFMSRAGLGRRYDSSIMMCNEIVFQCSDSFAIATLQVHVLRLHIRV